MIEQWDEANEHHMSVSMNGTHATSTIQTLILYHIILAKLSLAYILHPIAYHLVFYISQYLSFTIYFPISEVWLAVNVKTCPACKKRIWKDGGCMHVTCG